MQGKRKASNETKTKRTARPKKVSSSSGKKTLQSESKAQEALKTANAARKDLQKKLTQINADWKSKIKQIETQAFEKARAMLEKEYSKKEEARQKAINAAIAKFEKQFTQKAKRRTSTKSSSRSRGPLKKTKAAS